MAALHRRVPEEESAGTDLDINPVYFREKTDVIPRFRLAEHGVLPRTALQVVRDELILDGNARLNLATFVTTWMEPQADRLMAECFDRNMIDKDEWLQAETSIDVPVRDATQRTCMAALPPSHTT